MTKAKKYIIFAIFFVLGVLVTWETLNLPLDGLEFFVANAGYGHGYPFVFIDGLGQGINVGGFVANLAFWSLLFFVVHIIFLKTSRIKVSWVLLIGTLLSTILSFSTTKLSFIGYQVFSGSKIHYGWPLGFYYPGDLICFGGCDFIAGTSEFRWDLFSLNFVIYFVATLLVIFLYRRICKQSY